MPLIDIKVPGIGDFSEVTVIEQLVKPGNTLASDKASMEIASSHAKNPKTRWLNEWYR
jgi:pyruvate/2-oxoglutarate dehydrogenase complex dihydrolipoamide acyltransferase (E2) component